MKNMKRIHKVVVKRMVDEPPMAKQNKGESR